MYLWLYIQDERSVFGKWNQPQDMKICQVFGAETDFWIRFCFVGGVRRDVFDICNVYIYLYV